MAYHSEARRSGAREGGGDRSDQGSVDWGEFRCTESGQRILEMFREDDKAIPTRTPGPQPGAGHAGPQAHQRGLGPERKWSRSHFYRGLPVDPAMWPRGARAGQQIVMSF